MQVISRWVLPIAMVAIGIAILSGLLLRQLPPNSGLRPVLGLVAVLLGAHRFVASRSVVERADRRFGGERRRPWER
jgi:hypothetical protein